MTTSKIGLLFVHGIGEQKRFEHLVSSVRELAQLYRLSDPTLRVSVVDRTENWPHLPGHPAMNGEAPMTLSLVPRGPGRGEGLASAIDFECHEVWWSDLGTRTTIGESVSFWFWGLGQWSAIIYRLLDFSRVQTANIVELPRSVAKRPLVEFLSRLGLLFAALVALFTALTLTLVKTLASKLTGQAVTPDTLVQYLGDVRQYERRAKPGDAPPGDPGHPHRVAIRRRMISEMVALATRGHDKWYVVAHSLGTVVAYNGLTEIGHALPNYLSNALWKALPGKFKRDAECRVRADLASMMPARPPWLDDMDVINRPLLFENLGGLLTYGSPLDKFAAIWPRIVATATDRTPSAIKPVFKAETDWLNLAAQNDPVAGRISNFMQIPVGTSRPELINRTVAPSFRFLASHLDYLRSGERHSLNASVEQRIQVARWLAGDLKAASVKESPVARGLAWLFVLIGYSALFLVALGATAAVATLFGGGFKAFMSDGSIVRFDSIAALGEAWFANIGFVAGLAAATVLFAGLLRWRKEAFLNIGLARYDQSQLKQSMRVLIGILGLMGGSAVLLGFLALVGVAATIAIDLNLTNFALIDSIVDFYRTTGLPIIPGWATAIFASIWIFITITVHILINWIGPVFFADKFKPI